VSKRKFSIVRNYFLIILIFCKGIIIRPRTRQSKLKNNVNVNNEIHGAPPLDLRKCSKNLIIRIKIHLIAKLSIFLKV
jgi:hypothetical protein